MSQRDQSGPGQQSSGPGRGGSPASNRRDDPPEHDFDLPAWGDASANARPTSRAARSNRPVIGDQNAGPNPTRRSRSGDSYPSLGDALNRRDARRRSAYAPEPEADETAATGDAYDRLRVRSTRQRRAVQIDDFDADDWGAAADPYADRRRYPGETSQPARRGRPASTRQFKAPNMGAAVEFANQFERPIVAIAGVGIIGIVLMVATVAARQGQVADWFPIHLNAAGTPDEWGSPATLWRLPLMTVMVTLMAVVLAWFLAKRDAFAAQFVLASALLIQALCWIAVIHLAW
jgi:hypothetical protein